MSTDPKKEQKRNPKIEPDQIHPSSRLLPQVPQRTPPLPPTEPELPLQITEQANGLQVATRMDNEKLNIVRFNGNDFGVWKAQVEAVFTMWRAATGAAIAHRARFYFPCPLTGVWRTKMAGD